jgi:hypothetical protein
MAIRFQCSCGRGISVADQYAGKQGRCPQCGKVITIPRPTGTSTAPPAPAVPQAASATASQTADGVPAERRLVSCVPDKDGARYFVQGTTPGRLAADVGDFFQGEGYRLESGTRVDGVFGKGSDVLRALLGGFVKRYKFRVEIEPQQLSVRLTLSKAMSGWMGGAMGASQMKRETARIVEALESHLGRPA